MGKNFDATNTSARRLAIARPTIVSEIAAPVDLGGVDQVDAEVEGTGNDAARLPLGVVGAVAPFLRAELPRAQADAREPDAVCFEVPHRH